MADFATLDAVRVLKETEKATGGKALLEKHEKLIKEKGEERGLKTVRCLR